VDGGASVRRRRECEACGHRFTTFERYVRELAIVRKRRGGRQPFEVAKLRAGLRRAAHKRPDAEAAIEAIVVAVEEEARAADELTTRRIGELCLDGLREADRIAYLRFASVHKQLADLDAISAELSDLAITEDFPADIPELLEAEGSDSPDLPIQDARREVHA
jgi:transcriptional repressor NrdR